MLTNEEASNVLRIMASGIELRGYSELWISSFKEAYEMGIKALDERPQGEWKRRAMNEYLCSNCRYNVSSVESLFYKFCPKCGADMRKGGAES